MAFDASKSTSTATGLYNNLTFLPHVSEEMKTDPDAVVDKLQQLRKTCKSDIKPAALQFLTQCFDDSA